MKTLISLVAMSFLGAALVGPVYADDVKEKQKDLLEKQQELSETQEEVHEKQIELNQANKAAGSA